MSRLSTSSIERYYQAPGSYPEVKVQCPNMYYAKLLLEDYAGSTSELTAITTYVQNHIYGADEYYALAVEAFKGVSMVEMNHLEMLGDAIVALGGFPKFSTSRCGKDNYWDGSTVPSTHSMKRMLKQAIESEYAAIDQYYAHIDAIKDRYICELLLRIIKDEEYHIRLFKKLLRHLF